MPLDMTVMYAMHDALRRSLEEVARVCVRVDDDPRGILHRSMGWRLFTRTVRGHQSAEDEVLWPGLRLRFADRPGELVVLEAIGAEHAAIDQLIATIDELVTDPQTCSVHFGDLTDSLVTGLKGHLAHEEEAVIPLIRQALTARQWAAFERMHSERTGDLLSLGDRWNPAP